jgi:hypothetical protein
MNLMMLGSDFQYATGIGTLNTMGRLTGMGALNTMGRMTGLGASQQSFRQATGGPEGAAWVDSATGVYYADDNVTVLRAPNGVAWTEENYAATLNAPADDTPLQSAGGESVGSLLSKMFQDTGFKDSVAKTSLSDLVLAVQGKVPGISSADALKLVQAAKSKSMFSSANMPWFIMGGAVLVAALFLIGTRKR